jgi:hypothetical protein
MEDKAYFLIKVTFTTTHKFIHDAIEELKTKAEVRLTGTDNVQVLKSEIIILNDKSTKI